MSLSNYLFAFAPYSRCDFEKGERVARKIELKRGHFLDFVEGNNRQEWCDRFDFDTEEVRCLYEPLNTTLEFTAGLLYTLLQSDPHWCGAPGLIGKLVTASGQDIEDLGAKLWKAYGGRRSPVPLHRVRISLFEKKRDFLGPNSLTDDDLKHLEQLNGYVRYNEAKRAGLPTEGILDRSRRRAEDIYWHRK